MGFLCAYLKNIRLQLGYSMADVCSKTGITNSKLSRIENNKNQTAPSPDILKSLADLYNINLVELYLLAGYLDKDSLSSYKEGFNNTHLLTAQERNHIQEAINLFTKGRK